jgi:hypothetical protein
MDQYYNYLFIYLLFLKIGRGIHKLCPKSTTGKQDITPIPCTYCSWSISPPTTRQDNGQAREMAHVASHKVPNNFTPRRHLTLFCSDWTRNSRGYSVVFGVINTISKGISIKKKRQFLTSPGKERV